MRAGLAVGVFAAALLSHACQKKAGPAQEPESRAAEPVAQARVPLDPKTIVFSIRGEEESFRKCFFRTMNRSGSVTMNFLVDERGRVEHAEVAHSTLGAETTEECVRQRLLEHRFTSVARPSLGRWTFVFRLSEPVSEKRRKSLLARARSDHRPPILVTNDSQGELDTTKVDEIVQAQYPLYAHCYRDSIRRNPEATGVLRLRFEVGPEGAVTSVEDAGSVFPDPFAVDCMAEAFYAMAFPSPVGGPATVEYRLDLE